MPPVVKKQTNHEIIFVFVILYLKVANIVLDLLFGTCLVLECSRCRPFVKVSWVGVRTGYTVKGKTIKIGEIVGFKKK